jgi:3-isopropylmalate/(R)-2-methylmalate dehydratase small subunit
LPITISENIIQELSEYSKRKEEVEINLENQKILYGNKSIKFDLDPAKKIRLLEGLDDIGQSLKKISDIDRYENKIKDNKPWIMKND